MGGGLRCTKCCKVAGENIDKCILLFDKYNHILMNKFHILTNILQVLTKRVTISYLVCSAKIFPSGNLLLFVVASYQCISALGSV